MNMKTRHFKSSNINTYATPSCKSFNINTYKKRGVGPATSLRIPGGCRIPSSPLGTNSKFDRLTSRRTALSGAFILTRNILQCFGGTLSQQSKAHSALCSGFP